MSACGHKRVNTRLAVLHDIQDYHMIAKQKTCHQMLQYHKCRNANKT